jgi:hypothetical protein
MLSVVHPVPEDRPCHARNADSTIPLKRFSAASADRNSTTAVATAAFRTRRAAQAVEMVDDTVITVREAHDSGRKCMTVLVSDLSPDSENAMDAGHDLFPGKEISESRGTPRVAAIWTIGAMTDSVITLESDDRILYADVYRDGTGADVVRSAKTLEANRPYCLSIFHRDTQSWDDCLVRLEKLSSKPGPKDCYYRLMDQRPIPEGTHKNLAQRSHPKIGPAPADYEFFRTVPFLKAIHRDAVCPLLNHLTYRAFRPGERIITQGRSGNTCYIVQSGRCQVQIEKNGASHPISRIGPGEFVGEMALLTGENRSAHVVAETDVQLWALDRNLFQTLVETYPEVGTFLTEIIAERFATRKLTADRTIGKYRVTDIIGRGGFAIVYKGYHDDLKRPVAVKMLNHDLALNPEFLANFRKEARTIASLNCENIIKVYDIEERYRTVFIIMELLEGMTAREVLEKTGPIPEKEVVHILLKVCQGLKYAHDQGLVHQDIKPGNIFILPDGEIKILDFGLACACGTETFLSGTPYYMSPEQVECLPVDERADIYALGLTAYEMLTGIRPFAETDPFKAMQLHVDQPVPDPCKVLPTVHPDLRRFILKACCRDIEARFPHAAQAVEALHPLAERLGLTGSSSSPPKRKMSSLFLIYTEDQQLVLNRLMEEFSDKVKTEGIVLKAADFEDILA